MSTEKELVLAKYPDAYACEIVPTKAAVEAGIIDPATAGTGFGIRVNVAPYCMSGCRDEEAAWKTANHLISQGQGPQGMSPYYEFASAPASQDS